MKFFIGIVFVLFTLSGFSQPLEKITKTFSVPDGWKMRVVKDTSFFPSFGRRHVAVWEFKCNDEHTEPMWFYVFKYRKEDSAVFHQKATMYYALSNCMLVSNNDIKENFVSFTSCLFTDPLFKDPYNGNFNLMTGSPAIGAGVSIGTTPLYGGSFISGTDIGCY